MGGMAVLELSIAVVLLIIVLIVAFLLRKILVLVVNSVIGFFALFAAKLVLPDLVINVWSVLITAIGGILGFIIVLALHLLGVAF